MTFGDVYLHTRPQLDTCTTYTCPSVWPGTRGISPARHLAKRWFFKLYILFKLYII